MRGIVVPFVVYVRIRRVVALKLSARSRLVVDGCKVLPLVGRQRKVIGDVVSSGRLLLSAVARRESPRAGNSEDGWESRRRLSAAGDSADRPHRLRYPPAARGGFER